MKRLLIIVAVLLVATSVVTAQTAEKKEAPKAEPAEMKAKVTIVGEIAVKTIPAMTAALVLEKAADYVPEGGYKEGTDGASQAYEKMMSRAFEKLGAWMQAGNHPTGPCFAIFYGKPGETPAKDLTCKVGFPVGKDVRSDDVAKIEELPESQCAVVQYKGPYEEAMDVWIALDEWITDHQYEMSGPPSEVYLKGPVENVTPDEYLTEIRIPVQKLGTQEELEKEGKVEPKETKPTGK